MKSEVGRRVFVGSVVAGLPFLGGKAALLAQGNSGHDHVANAVDPVADYLVRQIARTYNSAQAAPRGEHFRALAAQLRTLSVYERALGLDDQVRAETGRLVDREGRNAVLYAEPNLEMRQKELQAYGFRIPGWARQVEMPPSHEQRESALDALLNGGLTPALDRIAAVAEKASLRADARSGRILVAQDDDWWKGFCNELWRQYQDAQLMALPMCNVASYLPLLVPVCAAMQAGAMTLLLAYLWECELFV